MVRALIVDVMLNSCNIYSINYYTDIFLSGALLIDEMKLTKALAFNRSKLKVEGFTDLGKYTSQRDKAKKGDHVLVFLFQPFKGKWVQALGCFLSKGSASGTVLQKLIIECIGLAERSELRIDAVVTDGASES